jgi:glucokinase
MLLAGDVGGTKTLIGLFERAQPRPQPLAVHSYPTNDFPSFTAILDAFALDVHQPFSVRAAVIGVAGPVIRRRAQLTNISWDIAADEITARFGTSDVGLLNDLEAMANSVGFLEGDEVEVLHEGTVTPGGNAVVIAAGTGLGQAYLHQINGRLHPVASEGGHADFAPRTDREMEFARMLRDSYGRAEVEHVLSGQGLVNLHRFTHRGGECAMLEGADEADAPARISQAGLAGRCQGCVEALRMFVTLYGAEAGNLALRGVAIGGVFVGGGIAPKILPALRNGSFIDAFMAKGGMSELLSRMPVKVILNAQAGLLGAAVAAQAIAGR